MSNELLASLFKPSMESEEEFQDVLEELSESSSDVTIGDVEQAEEEVESKREQLELVRTMVEGTADEDTVALESFSHLIDMFGMSYGQTEKTSLEGLPGSMMKEDIIQRIDTMSASLESVLTVSQESWSVKDLWDRAGGVERNASELTGLIKQLDAQKQWFSEHGIAVNALGQLIYMTVNQQFSKNIVKDTADTAKHVEDCLDVAKMATDTAEKIAQLVKNADVHTDAGAAALLDKVTALQNPSMAARQKLDGAYLLNNERVDFKISPLSSKHGLKLGQWENIGYYTKTILSKPKHDTKATRFLRFPAWLLGFSVGSKIAVGGVKAMGATGGALTVGTGIGVGVWVGFAASGWLNDRKKAKQIVNAINYDEMRKSFEKVIHLANASSAKRRALPGIFKKAFESKHETIKLLSISNELSDAGKEAINLVKTMYLSSDRLGWALNQWAFGTMETMTKNTQSIATKMVKASKK